MKENPGQYDDAKARAEHDKLRQGRIMQETSISNYPSLSYYGASKINEHTLKFWMELRGSWPYHATARWPTWYRFENVPDEGAFARLGWMHDEEDIRKADVTIVYSQSPDDGLRGALVEAGIALGAHRPVILIGNDKAYGTWRHHPRVFQFDLPSRAKVFMGLLAKEKQEHYTKGIASIGPSAIGGALQRY